MGVEPGTSRSLVRRSIRGVTHINVMGALQRSMMTTIMMKMIYRKDGVLLVQIRPSFKDIRTLDGHSHESNIQKCIWKAELSL